MRRLVVRAAMMALLALALVSVGALTASNLTTAAVTVSANALSVAPAPAVSAPDVVVLSAEKGTTCNPGRGNLHMQASASPPGPSLALLAPGTGSGSAYRWSPSDFSLVQALDRTPAALTHLDLGICRT
ncbi:hypothetical protein [Arthrobacter sp. GMC3]|uniref:hypothetical protein n=1 Tax=Arthrobacter sp. GMC3 TaxID=2058894 RepID=UPI0011B05B2C|nr:hypothetical protein [Arthrobacter sp. GMC3]